MANPVKVIFSTLKEQVEDLGWKAKEVGEHYNLNQAQVKALMKETGLNFRKKGPSFVVVMDEENNEQQAQQEVVDEAKEILDSTKNPFKAELQTVVEEEEIIPLDKLFSEEEAPKASTPKNFWEK